ncbi:MAG: lamin tail domain-containing protein, partial [Bacteroidetes bacterium]|nr:lamin tail domain-containing protein [Bacteroidota bacterium]
MNILIYYQKINLFYVSMWLKIFYNNTIMRFILFLLLFSPLLASAQITDNFSDGDFSHNPLWTGDTTEFTVNTSQQLQLNNTTAGASYLSTASANSFLDNTEWHFYIKQSFSPSSSNYARVYLASDKANLEGPLNGYYLQFGETGNLDAVELYRQTGLTSTSVARGNNSAIALSFAIGIKVTRDTIGNWNLYVDAAGGTIYALQASGNDKTFSTSNYFGISTVYSASNATKFYFDDFYNGAIILDVNAPIIVSSTVISDTKVDILFNEHVDITTSQTVNNYSANNSLNNPVNVFRDSINFGLVHLTFANQFISELKNTLTITNVRDLSGNGISNINIDFIYLFISTAAFNDLVINEILFDPKIGGVDFIEIYNRSSKIIDLRSITVSQYDTVNNVLTGVSGISKTRRLIFPKEYLVLSENGNAVKSQYNSYNPNGFLDLSILPSMNIESGTICLATGTTIIDLLKYNEDMHFPLLNETKGISLERINFERITLDRSNWHSAAEAVGFATPAYQNSQYQNPSKTDNILEIIPEIFSPDEDGMND